MNPEVARNPGPEIEDVIGRLLASANACDNRKGIDLRELLTLSRGRWRNRLEILRLGSTPERALVAVCRLQLAGLVWSDGQPTRQDSFACAVSIPICYPLSLPGARFLGAIPWCGHVVHKDFLPEESRLPSHLQEYLRLGHGRCCYMRSSQWMPDACTLAIVLWQVSRLVTFERSYGEPASLNPTARDYAQRLAGESGRLPLGKPFPYPLDDDHQSDQAAAVEKSLAGDSTDTIEWIGFHIREARNVLEDNRERG